MTAALSAIAALYPVRNIFSASASGRGGAGSAAGPRLMTEFRDFVALNYRHESVSSPEKGLKRSLKPILRELAARFDDLDSIDRIVAAHGTGRRGKDGHQLETRRRAAESIRSEGGGNQALGRVVEAAVHGDDARQVYGQGAVLAAVQVLLHHRHDDLAGARVHSCCDRGDELHVAALVVTRSYVVAQRIFYFSSED